MKRLSSRLSLYRHILAILSEMRSEVFVYAMLLFSAASLWAADPAVLMPELIPASAISSLPAGSNLRFLPQRS